MQNPPPPCEQEPSILARQQSERLLELERRISQLEHRESELLAALSRREHELAEHRRAYGEWEWVFDHALDLLLIHNDDGTVARVSPSVTAILGYMPDEFMHLGVDGVVHPDDIAKANENLGKDNASRDGLKLLCRCRHKDGGWRWLAWTTLAPHYQKRDVCRSFSIGRDITATKLTEQELLHRAQHDALTGLANRACFDQSVEAAITRAGRNGSRVALLLIDLDGFKAVNDNHGHKAGDAVLVAVAQRLRATQREVDLVARLGGDEFACVVENVELASLETVAARILSTVEEPIFSGTTQVGVGCSIGIAIWPDSASDAHSLFEHADRAMYKVKAGGKRGYALYAP